MADAKTDRRGPRPMVALAVPFADKDRVKALGARFEAAAKAWAVPEGVDPGPFAGWLPKPVAVSSGAGETPEHAFRAALAEAGLDEPEPSMDGSFHRARVEGDRGSQKSGTYIFIEAPDGPGWYMKNHRTGEQTTGKWSGGLETGEDAENRRALRLQAAIDAETRRLAREARWEEKAAEASARVASLPAERPEGTYLDRKGVGLHGDARFDGKNLVLPYRDIDGNVTTLQTIRAGEGAAKLYMKDAKKEGAFFLMGEIGNGKPILVCEGYATGASLHEMTGHAVAVAGDAGSLERIAMDLRGRLPASLLLVCPDDDREAVAAGKENRGMDAGIDAANFAGGHLAPPPFPEGIKGSDWNDLERAVGRLAAGAMIEWEIEQAAQKEYSDMLGRFEADFPDLPVCGWVAAGAEPTEGRVLEVGRGWTAIGREGDILLVENAWFSGGPPPAGADVSIALEKGGCAWEGAQSAAASEALFALCSKWSSDAKEARALIAAGADPEAKADRGMTPLHAAARAGNAGMIRLLVEAGADVAAVDDKGATPLHWAAYAGRLNASEALIKAGADIEAADKYGSTPLRSAIIGGKPGTASWLEREAGANPDVKPVKAAAGRAA